MKDIERMAAVVEELIRAHIKHSGEVGEKEDWASILVPELRFAYESGVRGAMTEWQPIETAPKYGVSVLACSRRDVQVLRWVDLDHGGHWGRASHDIPAWQPTHWMPLPNPPKGK